MPGLPGEVYPEVPMPDARGHHHADHGIELRPEDATCDARQAQGQRGHHQGEGEREQDVAQYLGRHAGQDDPSGT
jgi:hypothetical protein